MQRRLQAGQIPFFRYEIGLPAKTRGRKSWRNLPTALLFYATAASGPTADSNSARSIWARTLLGSGSLST